MRTNDGVCGIVLYAGNECLKDYVMSSQQEIKILIFFIKEISQSVSQGFTI